MRLTIRGIVDAVLLLTGVAALVIAVERHEWALFALSLAISLLILVSWGLRLALRSSARLWTKSLMWRYSPHGGRTALAAGWLLKRVLGDSSDTVRAYDSLVWSGNSSSPKRPLLAPMRTVFRRRGWGTWAFSSRVIDSGVEVDTKLQGSRSSKTLRVVLSDSPLGIYNNAGKKFLDVNTPVDPERAGELSRSARAMLLDFTSDSMRTLDAPLLRWASAGVLPIARWRSADWVVLFFRDIRPVGWNLANGASENERDQRHVAELAQREFCEELLVCRNMPSDGVSAVIRPFVFPGPGGRDARLASPRFTAQHRKLRHDHDHLHLQLPERSPDDVIPLSLVPTPWRCEVVSATGRVVTPHVIPSLNPFEMGVELIQVMRFPMDDDDVLLDGEILESGPALARRPIALIRLEAMRDIVKGETWHPTTRDRMVLPVLDANDVHIFGNDIELRRRRLADPLTPAAERSKIDSWLAHFGPMFMQTSLVDEQSRQVCPVVWKTLEAAITLELI